MKATPVQLATMTAIIANGGYRIRPPHLVRVNDYFGKEDLKIDPHHLAVLKDAMDQVVNHDKGHGQKI